MALTVVLLGSLITATVARQSEPEEPCSGGGHDPVPVNDKEAKRL